MIRLHRRNCRIELSPERGAIVTSITFEGRELLYLDQTTFDDPNSNVRGGVPVLFPICGPLHEPNGYDMKQHGFARNMEWNVVFQGVDQVALEITDTPQTLAQYPHPFRYRITYFALPNGLRIAQEIENRGDVPMPAQFGFHPYFLVDDKSTLSFNLPIDRFQDNKSEAEGPFPGFDFDRDEIDWAFPHPSANEASFACSNGRVKLVYDDSYPVLVFWTLKGKPFVCLEPWSSSRLAFPEGRDIHQINPGDCLKARVEIQAG